jgi:hypothetical protein
MKLSQILSMLALLLYATPSHFYSGKPRRSFVSRSFLVMKKTIAIAALCVLLAGCQTAKTKPATAAGVPAPTPVTPSATVTQPAQPMASVGTDDIMYPCMKELNALQQVSPRLYQTRSVELNDIVAQAKLYMRIRDNVSTDIHQIMDAAYQFRIAKTCNRISTDLTNALIERVTGA